MRALRVWFPDLELATEREHLPPGSKGDVSYSSATRISSLASAGEIANRKAEEFVVGINGWRSNSTVSCYCEDRDVF